MTPEEAYAAIGGNYQNIVKRLGSEASVQRFCKMFLADESYKNIRIYLEQGNIDDAFRMAHTLKGSSQMLELTDLYHSSFDVTEALRNKEFDNLEALLTKLDQDYAVVFDAFSLL